jgi:hypothetical protein
MEKALHRSLVYPTKITNLYPSIYDTTHIHHSQSQRTAVSRYNIDMHQSGLGLVNAHVLVTAISVLRNSERQQQYESVQKINSVSHLYELKNKYCGVS